LEIVDAFLIPHIMKGIYSCRSSDGVSECGERSKADEISAKPLTAKIIIVWRRGNPPSYLDAILTHTTTCVTIVFGGDTNAH